MGVKLVNCLFLLVVASIRSQNFQLREKDDPKDENPLDIHPREVSRSECVFARTDCSFENEDRTNHLLLGLRLGSQCVPCMEAVVLSKHFQA